MALDFFMFCLHYYILEQEQQTRLQRITQFRDCSQTQITSSKFGLITGMVDRSNQRWYILQKSSLPHLIMVAPCCHFPPKIGLQCSLSRIMSVDCYILPILRGSNNTACSGAHSTANLRLCAFCLWKLFEFYLPTSDSYCLLLAK